MIILKMSNTTLSETVQNITENHRNSKNITEYHRNSKNITEKS